MTNKEIEQAEKELSEIELPVFLGVFQSALIRGEGVSQDFYGVSVRLSSRHRTAALLIQQGFHMCRKRPMFFDKFMSPFCHHNHQI